MTVKGTLRVCTSQNPGQKNSFNRKELQGLAMTRSIGDLMFKQTGGKAVIADPDLTVTYFRNSVEQDLD